MVKRKQCYCLLMKLLKVVLEVLVDVEMDEVQDILVNDDMGSQQTDAYHG